MRTALLLALILAALPALAADEARSVQSLLDEARERYTALEYDKVLPLANEVLAREDVSAEQRADAYVLQGSALAIVGDNIEAEKSFRLVLQMRPDFDLPADTSPRILSILRKVQAEVKEMRAQARRLRLEKIVAELELKSEHPAALEGGLPVEFAYRFKDPTGAIDAVRVQYRRAGEPAFASLPLARDDEGAWTGSVPGEYTENEGGLTLEIVVETRDAEGEPLLIVGSREAPVALAVAPGTVERAAPPPLPAWTFWTGAGVTTLVAAAAAGTGIGTLLLEGDVEARLASSATNPVDGAELQQQFALGENLALVTNVLLISAGVLAVGTAVTLPFTNFEGE